MFMVVLMRSILFVIRCCLVFDFCSLLGFVVCYCLWIYCCLFACVLGFVGIC